MNSETQIELNIYKATKEVKRITYTINLCHVPVSPWQAHSGSCVIYHYFSVYLLSARAELITGSRP